MSDNAIEIKNLVKKYKSGTVALDNINLTIKSGSFFALLGPNGGGKSTLINIISNVVKKTSGEISIFGQNTDDDHKNIRSLIGVVPQELSMDTFFTIEESLNISSGYYGIKPQDRKVEEILNALGLYEKRKSTAKQLSGGMRRRFLVAKAMVHSPKILILDEPTAGVDINLREQLWEYVTYLNSQGTTILITTHYLEEAERLCNEIAFINKGKIIKADSKENLSNNFQNKQIYIELAGELETIPNNLTALGAKLVNNKQLFFTSNDINLILKELCKTDIRVNEISTIKPDLQTIFNHFIYE